MDCRTAFGDLKTLPAAELLTRLKADDEAPWADMSGDGLKPRRLGLMLGEFHIRAEKRRWDIGQARVYDRAAFVDSWNRYCPPEPVRDGSRPLRPIRPTPSQTGDAMNPWDASCVPAEQYVPDLTRAGTHGTQRTQPPPIRPAAVCITCRGPLSYDDGTHTHPTCATTTQRN